MPFLDCFRYVVRIDAGRIIPSPVLCSLSTKYKNEHKMLCYRIKIHTRRLLSDYVKPSIRATIGKLINKKTNEQPQSPTCHAWFLGPQTHRSIQQ